MNPDQLYRHGCEAFAAGDYSRAEACFRSCVEQFPDNADLRNALGSALQAKGILDEAAEHLAAACSLKPNCAEFHYNLANLLRSRHKRLEAEEEYLYALQLNSGLQEALQALGNLYLEEERLESAEACLQRAVQISPDSVAALYELGQLRQRQGDPAAAEAIYQRCAEYPPALNALGMLRVQQNKIEEARSLFERAIGTDSEYIQARCNLAVLDTWCGRLDQAVSAFNGALALAPEDGDIHFNLSFALLAAGRMTEGWREHEWRFCKSNPVPVRHARIPRWQGEPLQGKTILVHAEQGYGDSLQFIRYVMLLAKRGATVLIEGQDRNITPLLATVYGVSSAFSRGEPLPAAPDFQVPMMSLAAPFGDEGWPPPVPPYLNIPSNRIEFWRNRLASLPGLKVGIAWAGRPEHQNDSNRSIPQGLCDPLGHLQGISWVSLQFGPNRPDPINLPLLDFSDSVTDFSDSAALVCGLDLVVTIDSAVAHLAGALNVPVCLLLPWNPDWRWMHDRQDSVWYPSMRIYRQPAPGSWNEVIGKVATDLEGLVS